MDFNTESELFLTIMECTLGYSNFSASHKKVITKLKENDKPHNTNFFNCINFIIRSTDYDSSQRLYTLYLLIKATESAEAGLMELLAKSKFLLEFIFITSQVDRKKPKEEKGKKFFGSESTSEQRQHGILFVRGCLECLAYWHKTHGTKPIGSLKIFYTMHESLRDRVSFPEDFKLFNNKQHRLNINMINSPTRLSTG